MTTLSNAMAAFRHFLRDRSGNFGLMTALLLPVSVGVAGLAMDVTKMVQIKSLLQNSVDAAALAAASAMSKGMSQDDAMKLAQSFISSQMANGLVKDNDQDASEQLAKDLNAIGTVNTTTTSSSSATYDIALTGSYTLAMNPLSQVMGWTSVTITAYGKAEAAKQVDQKALSLYLVLDRSGSMSFVTDTVDSSRSSCQNYTESNWSKYPKLAATSPCYVNKITSLKTAVAYMAQTLNAADATYTASGSPSSKLVRVGAVAYNSSAFTAQSVAWGTASANTYVQNIPTYPTGGTDARGALTIAYDALKSANTTEATAHTGAGVANFDRYIILMTDGEMTGSSSSWSSSIDSAVRTQCATIKADGIQIFSVAFMAPTRGKSLLSACASSSANYYEPTTMAGLVAAFGDIAQKATTSDTRLTN
ncbi:TadE/TadG family type IV pilus assembly protein [Rhizobium paknamense]|uniref:Flp pilus assembly protein TadG n=1 Tax=Rhizobium paknamense TaxID=1206817 RepID=A0ABU0IDF3_9HYPH|nr:TadE/TadG family type IV pilus assembly protein [Rhizobium paknamense]MDQ0456267.1 Flp pilus assembly protein TadG [Rhizobium paknamense]